MPSVSSRSVLNRKRYVDGLGERFAVEGGVAGFISGVRFDAREMGASRAGAGERIVRRRAIGMVARETSSASFRSMASETVVESSSGEMLPAAVEAWCRVCRMTGFEYSAHCFEGEELPMATVSLVPALNLGAG